jgi:hypothetical protein
MYYIYIYIHIHAHTEWNETERDRVSESLGLSGCGVGCGAGAPRVCERLMTIYILYYSRRWSRSRECCSIYKCARGMHAEDVFNIVFSSPVGDFGPVVALRCGVRPTPHTPFARKRI